MIPPALAAEVRSLLHNALVESYSDARLLRHALAHPEQATPATVTWLEAVVARNGRAFTPPAPTVATPA